MKKIIKICSNPNCGDEIVAYISSKKKYCNDRCRNHHGYLRRAEFNLEFEAHKKGIALNYRILKFHLEAGVFSEKLEKLVKFGFNPWYLPQMKVDREFAPNVAYYIIKDIRFGLNPATNEVIIFAIKNENNEN